MGVTLLLTQACILSTCLKSDPCLQSSLDLPIPETSGSGCELSGLAAPGACTSVSHLHTHGHRPKRADHSHPPASLLLLSASGRFIPFLFLFLDTLLISPEGGGVNACLQMTLFNSKSLLLCLLFFFFKYCNFILFRTKQSWDLYFTI